MAKTKVSILIREDAKARNGKPLPRSMLAVVAIVLYCLAFLLSQRSGLKPKSISFARELDDSMDKASRNAGTEDTEEHIELVPSIATRRPQRVYELPYEEQKGSWIGNHWVPPKGWRYFSAGELKTVYKDKSIMWVGDSLARRAALTMYGVLNETTANSSDMNVPAAAIDSSGVIDVNKRQKTEFCAKWNQPNWCRTMPGGVGDYVYVVKNRFSDIRSFLVDELSGKSNITENFDTIIIAIGNWDSVSPKEERSNILSNMTASIDALGKLQSIGKTIIWRTSGFRYDNGKTNEYFFEVNKKAVDQIKSIATRMQQESKKFSNLTCINWSGAIFPRSFGSNRIKGDTQDHYGLEGRLVFIQMITNHLASRQGLEF
jgi:hypothetical protein